MYKEEMDRLGFDEGGWFKKLATLGSLFGNVATPPKTEYELHSEQADKRYRNRPADREMFDVTTNYLMEQEDRNIQDAELMEELNTTAESWTNAEPKQFIKNLIKYPMSKALIGAGKEDIEDLDKRAINYIMRSLDKIEDPTQRKLAERDIADYTSGDKKIPSLSSPIFDALRHGTLSYEFGNKLFARPALQAKERMQAVRASIRKEDPDTQKKDALNNLTAFRIKDANPNLTKEEFNQIFIDRFNESVRKVNNKEKLIPGIDFYLTAEDVKNMDKAGIIRYPIGVDTPIFTTQEEADIYMDALPKATRSVVRGIIQGTVKYLGGTSLSSAFELSGRYQAMSPIYEKGLLSREDIEEYEQLPGFLETEAKHTRALGETVVPGDVDEESVWLSETATGLGILGVGIKQGVDLIRHYGPKAVTKLKSYFVKNPESTVDEAVKGVLGKAATRRDVMKGMGTGAVVAGTAGTAGVIGKASMLAKGTATAVKGGTVITSGSLFRTINRIPREVLGKDFDKYIRHVYSNPKAKWIDEANEPNPAVLSKIKEVEKYFKKYGLNSKKDYSVMDDTTFMKPYVHADEGWTSVGDWRAGKRTPPEHIVYTHSDDPVHIAYAQVDDIETAAFDIGIQNKLIKQEDIRIAEHIKKLKKEGKYTGKEKDIDLYYDSLTDDTQLMDLVSKQEIWDETLNEMIKASQKDYDPTAWTAGFKNSALRDNSKFLGEKNGIEFFEIDGMPVIRIEGTFRTVGGEPHSIILPNAQGIEKIATRKKIDYFKKNRTKYTEFWGWE